MTWWFARNTKLEGLRFAQSLPVGAWALIILAVMAVSVMLYRRERGLKRFVRVGLTAIRITVLLLVIAAIFEPVVALRRTREDKRSLAVLVDTSQSMAVRDPRKDEDALRDAAVALGLLPLAAREASAGTIAELNTKQRDAIAAASRMDLARNLLLKSAAPVFDSLADDLDVRYYTFSDSLEVLGQGEVDPRAAMAALEAKGEGTSLATALREVAAANRGDALAGIVLLSDGIETGANQPEVVAYDLGARGIPVYTVPLGVPEPDDVSIRNVIVQDVAFVGDTVPVRVQLRSRGYEKRTALLTIVFNDKEVAREQVVLDGGVQYVELAFDARVKAKGAVRLEAAIEPFLDEATAENNRVTRSVRVVNEKINVLCIEGSARWEFRYLRAILKRDPRVNATFIATRAGNELAMHSSDYIARFPEDAADAFKYDLVILGDVDSSFFTAGEFARLEELVSERGGSLLMLAGPKYSPSSYEGTAVASMLPVKFNAREKWHEVDKSVYPVLTPEGRSSLVLTLEMDREQNDRLWTHVAPLDRLPPLLEPRPGASVLAVLSDSGVRLRPYPLISWQRYGTGKCMLMATDRLWRLRFRSGDKYHWRVWSQCIQFLTLSRLMGEHKQIRMETDRVSYPVGEQVRVYAEVLDDSYEPVLQGRYDVFIGEVDDQNADSNKTRVSLRPDAARPGLYAGYFTPHGEGHYRVEAGEDDLDYANMIEFQVADARAELATTSTQIDRLRRVATLSDGRCLALSELGDLASLPDRTRKLTTIRTERPLWDDSLLAVLVIVLMGCEWLIRRRNDLL